MGIFFPLTGLMAYRPVKTPVLSLARSVRSRSDFSEAAWIYSVYLASAVRSGQFVHHVMLGGNYHIGGTKQGIGTGCINPEFFGQILPLQNQLQHLWIFQSSCAAYPSLLRASRAFPIRSAIVRHKGYPQHPLLQIFPDYRVAAFFMGTVGQHFFIGTNNAAMLTPPYLCIVIIGQSLAVGIFPDGLFSLFP